jgi:hypothetical protein
VEGITVNKNTDPLTGLVFFEMIDEGERSAAAKGLKPMIKVVETNLMTSCHVITITRSTYAVTRITSNGRTRLNRLYTHFINLV